MIDLPIWIAIITLCCTFWISIILILVSFTKGWQYKFVGPELGKDSINNASAKFGDAVYHAGKDVHNHFDEKSNTVNAEFTEKKDEEK